MVMSLLNLNADFVMLLLNGIVGVAPISVIHAIINKSGKCPIGGNHEPNG